jgi:hemoglobin-like flavoprotein
MLSTTVTTVSAYEYPFSDLLSTDWTATIGESSQQVDLAKALDVYKDVLDELGASNDEVASIQEQLEGLEVDTTQFDSITKLLQDAMDENQDVKDRLEEIKEAIQDANDGNVVLGDSLIETVHQYLDTLQSSDWDSYIDADVDLGDFQGFQLIESANVGDIVTAIMDKYDGLESYIADGSEGWLPTDDSEYTLSVKFSNGDDEFEVKFSPIYDGEALEACYMYVVSSLDEIKDGYTISSDDYANIKDALDSAFLGDNVVAINNGIESFDDLVQYIKDTYEQWSDYFFDVDGDGQIDALDLLKDKKYLLGLDEVLGNYDCNQDGTSDSRDLLQLKKRLLGMDLD